MMSKDKVPENLKVQPTEYNVQIHYINNHYIVSRQHRGIVTVYDSMFNALRVKVVTEELKALYKLLEAPNSVVQYIVPQSQGYTQLCGAFANAYMLSQGLDPTDYNLDTSLMRKHLRKCLSQGKLSPFPLTKKPLLPSGQTGSWVYTLFRSTIPVNMPCDGSKQSTSTKIYASTLGSIDSYLLDQAKKTNKKENERKAYKENKEVQAISRTL